MENLILLLIFELFLFLAAFYLSQNDIMAPSCMFCIMFIISTTFAILNINNWDATFSFDTTILISTGMLAFVFAEVLFRFLFCGQLRGSYTITEEYDDAQISIKPWILTAIILFDVVIIYLYLRSIFRVVGGSMTNIYSYFHAYRVMGINSLENEGTSITFGPINSLLRFVTGFGYMGAYMLTRNAVQRNATISAQIKYLIIIVLSILPSMMSGGRTGILRMIAALLILYYISWHQKNGWTRNLSLKYVRIGLIAFFVLAPSFYFSLGLLGRVTNRTMTDYISDYLASSIFLLDQYLEAPTQCISWAEESLVGVRKLLSVLGIGEPSTKYNLEFRYLGIGRSNVYTFFRRPLHDFGYFGMYVFVILIAFFFAWMYYKKIKYQPRNKCMGYIITYGYLYYWIICASIVQYSVNMISAGAIIQIAIAVIAFKVFTYRSRTTDEQQSYYPTKGLGR